MFLFVGMTIRLLRLWWLVEPGVWVQGTFARSAASAPDVSSEVRQVPAGPVQRNRHDWRLGVRLGPDASGALAYEMKVRPLGMSRVGAREILDVSPSPA